MTTFLDILSKYTFLYLDETIIKSPDEDESKFTMSFEIPNGKVVLNYVLKPAYDFCIDNDEQLFAFDHELSGALTIGSDSCQINGFSISMDSVIKSSLLEQNARKDFILEIFPKDKLIKIESFLAQDSNNVINTLSDLLNETGSSQAMQLLNSLVTSKVAGYNGNFFVYYLLLTRLVEFDVQ